MSATLGYPRLFARRLAGNRGVQPMPGSAVRFVCPFCRRACEAGISALGAVVANHAAPWCLPRSSSSAVEYMRAVRSRLGGDCT